MSACVFLYVCVCACVSVILCVNMGRSSVTSVGKHMTSTLKENKGQCVSVCVKEREQVRRGREIEGNRVRDGESEREREKQGSSMSYDLATAFGFSPHPLPLPLAFFSHSLSTLFFS